MPSDGESSPRVWSDPRYFITTFVMPIGALSFAGTTMLVVWMIYHEIKNEAGLSTYMILLNVGVLLFGLSLVLYYTIGAFQIFFLELRERFIAHKVTYRDGEFQLEGYWAKHATFYSNEVEKVEPFMLSERWFQKRTGSLLSRSTRFTIPRGTNVNLKITLRDGRIFYFPGEMGRYGQWKAEDVKELRDFMESLAAPGQPISTSAAV